MTQGARWMWYPGDFEIHHRLKLELRRDEYDYVWPAVWRLDDCWHNVKFAKSASIGEAELVCAHTNAGGVGFLMVDGVKHPFGRAVRLEPGSHALELHVAKVEGLPCAFVEGKTFASGEGWQVCNLSPNYVNAGFSDMYTAKDDDPEQFKFAYARIEPVLVEGVNGGTLYDFGRQTFARLRFLDVQAKDAVWVYYGESKTEALDLQDCYLRDQIPAGAKAYSMPSRTFRYLFFPDGEARFALEAEYEYLPLEYVGAFECDDAQINEIWNTAAYTFHLNSREFFLDGLKRDRWVWSGDAYQSYLINYYLFGNNDLVKRTTLALRGKDPLEQHINTILDYSLYWIMGIGDYYRYTGDIAFLQETWPRLQSLLDFCLERRDEHGFFIDRPGDWTFIDWSEIDKTAPVCAEQMLLHQALRVAAMCAKLLGQNGEGYLAMADALKKNIDAFYWDEEKQAYIDSFASGKRNVTRHANIFAILHGFCGEERKQAIKNNVLLNDKIVQITTPYFRFYELAALYECGMAGDVLSFIREYWGGMIQRGATAFWEYFDPTEDFPTHYGMYGKPYDKSLCHAWGASPIYLLGRYVLGVRPDENCPGAFVCEPTLGGLGWFRARTPLPGGSFKVELNGQGLRVANASCCPVRLCYNGKTLTVRPGENAELT